MSFTKRLEKSLSDVAWFFGPGGNFPCYFLFGCTGWAGGFEGLPKLLCQELCIDESRRRPAIPLTLDT